MSSASPMSSEYSASPMPSVPGIRLRAELGGRPRTWRGYWEGEEVDVVVLPVSSEPGVRTAALRAMEPLVGVAPGCRAVLLCHQGIAVVGAAVHGRPLTEFPPLEVGHAVAVGTALAQALSVVHARGVVWGGPFDEVLVDDCGEAHLPLHGVASRRLAGDRRPARADVEVLVAMLADRSPGLGVQAPDDAATLVRRLRRRARPRPLVLAAEAQRPSRRPSWHPSREPSRTPLRVPSRRTLVTAGALAIVGAGGLAMAVRTAGGGTGVKPKVSVPAGSPSDWRRTVSHLDRARAAALSGSGALGDADAVGSPAFMADTVTAARLRAAAPRTASPLPAVSTVRALRLAADDVTLAVTDTLPPYAYRDRAGRVIATSPARASRTWTVRLTHTAAGWRFRAVS